MCLLPLLDVPTESTPHEVTKITAQTTISTGNWAQMGLDTERTIRYLTLTTNATNGQRTKGKG
jgi:hypothetical protein